MDGIKYSVDVISHDVWDIGIGVINPFSISPYGSSLLVHRDNPFFEIYTFPLLFQSTNCPMMNSNAYSCKENRKFSGV